MRRCSISLAVTAACGVIMSGWSDTAARAAITVDGTVDAAYGSPLAAQTNNTGFGDNTDASGASGGGSELDAAYGLVQGGYLNLFLAGNLETNFNHLNVFIADGRAGQSTLNAAGSLAAMNGSKFSPGFAATYALDINGGGGPPATEYVNANDLTQATGPSSFPGSFAPNDGAAHTLANGIVISLNNTNVAGVTGDGGTGSAADPTAAAAVTTGFEISIPLSVLGTPHGAIEVLADINGGGNGFLSNQFLPGLPTVTPNVGGGSPYSVAGSSSKFDFSSVAGQFFTVPGAVGGTNANGIWQATGSGSWGTAANWVNGVIPGVAGDSAAFNASNTAAATVTLDAPRTVGELTFNSPNSYTIAPGTGGTLTINDAGDALGVNPAISVMAGSHAITAPVAITAGVTVAAVDATTLTISGAVSGTGPVTKTGGGTLVLSGSNSFTGTATVLAGSLQLNGNASGGAATLALGDPNADNLPVSLAIGTAGLTIPNAILTNQDLAGGSTARIISATYAAGTSTLSGPVTLDGAVVFNAAAGGTLAVTGVVADGTNTSGSAKHDLTVNAPPATGNASTGTVVLAGASTYTGVTTVNAGTLVVAGTGSLASPTVTVNAGANLNVSGGLSTSTALTSNGRTFMGVKPGDSLTVRKLASATIGSGGVIQLSGGAALTGNPSAARQVVVTPSLSIAGGTGAWTGQLDLGGNALILQGGDLAQTSDQAKSGLNLGGTGGLFTGQGITSSTAAADGRHLTAIGVIQNSTAGAAIYASFDAQAVSAADVLVRYTYFGDANLDGVVNAADYTMADAGFVGRLSGWQNGDFNYDGVVDGSDYTLLDNAFNEQTGSLGSPAQAVAPTAVAAAEVSAVPEPATLGMVGAVVVGLLGGRRRRR